MTARTVAEIIGSIVGVILLWLVMQKPVSGPIGVPQEAKQAPEVAKVAKEEIKPAKVLAYSQTAKQGVDIPQAAKNDPAIAVLDSSTIPTSDHSQTVTEVLNTSTGDTRTYVTTDPYPWLAMESEKRFTVAYGIKNQGAKVFRFQYAHELAQIKMFHFGPLVTLDTDGAGFAGITARW